MKKIIALLFKKRDAQDTRTINPWSVFFVTIIVVVFIFFILPMLIFIIEFVLGKSRVKVL